MAALDAGRPAALVLSPETPYPLQGGGALRTASVLHFLAQTHDIDLIVFRHRPDQDPAAALPAGLVRRVHLIDLPAHRKDFLSRAARNAWRLARGVPPLVDRFRGFGQSIRHFTSGEHYGIAIIEHFWCAEYFPVMQAAANAVVLNLHNVESELHRTSAQAGGGWNAWIHRRFVRNSQDLERTWLPRFAELLTASEADAVRVRSLAPGTNPRVFPNAIPWTPCPVRPEEEIIAFSGNLEYHPNYLAVRFFADKIWPGVKAQWPALNWRLIGMNPEAVSGMLAGRPGIELTGSVADAVHELAAARVVVVPLLSGSGTRLKIIEAWAAGRAIVSTNLGAEGLPACHERNILLADTPTEFAAAIGRLLRDPDLRRSLGAAGRQEYERGLCWRAAWTLLESSLLSPERSYRSKIEY